MNDDTNAPTLEEFIEDRFDSPEGYDETIEVQHTKQSARIRMNVKRGTGTRDQEEVTVEVAAPSIHDLAPQVEPAREIAFREMREARDFDPQRDDSDADE